MERQLNEPIRVLKQLQEAGFASAILAGGCIRDAILGKEIKDYDIYICNPLKSKEVISHRDWELVNEVKSFFKKIFKKAEINYGSNLEIVHSTSYTGTGGTDPKILADEGKMRAIWEITPYLGAKPYQIIMLHSNPIEFVLHNFDVGLCKAYCDGNTVTVTDDFTNDFNNKTLTVIAKNMTHEEFEYSQTNHIPRILQKYQDYKVMVAPHNVPLIPNYA